VKDSRKTKAQLIAELDGLRQHATQQNREMTIQSALEQVRARALAMQTSADLFSVTAVLHEQMAAVGIEAIATAIEVVDLEGESLQSAAMVGGDLSSPWQTIDLASFRTIPVHVRLLAAYQRGEITYTAQLEGEELSAYWTFWRERLFAVNPEARDREFANRPRVSMTHVFFPRGWIYLELGRVIGEPGEGEYQVVDDDPPTAADLETIKRFADVFDFAYSRFLELKEKEGQNRELTIQNALERVRARALGMQTSADLNGVVWVLLEQSRAVGHPVFVVQIGLMAGHDQAEVWGADVFSTRQDTSHPHHFHGAPAHGEDVKAARSRGEPWHVGELPAAARSQAAWRSQMAATADCPADARAWVEAAAGTLYSHRVFFKEGIVAYHAPRCMDDGELIDLKRFTDVFDFAYGRFLELRQKEDQNRELTIQNALERVRARALGMQTSDELGEVSATLLDALGDLGFDSFWCSINLFDFDGNEFSAAVQLAGAKDLVMGVFPLVELDVEGTKVGSLLAAFRRQQEYHTWEHAGTEKDAHLAYWTAAVQRTNPDFVLPQRTADADRIFEFDSLFHDGSLSIATSEAVTEEEQTVLKRLTNVFDFAYSRFLELKQKEEQNRELTVQNALERVRARALGMRSSDDIGEVTTQLFREFRDLGIPMRRSGIWILDVEPGKGEIWLTEPSGALLKGEPFDTSVMAERRDMARTFEAFKEGERFLYFDYTVAEIVDAVFFFRDRLHMSLEYMGEDAKVIANRLSDTYPDDCVHAYHVMFPQGTIFLVRTAALSDQELEITQRFAGVFGFAFSRMQEITRAEQAARQAERRGAVDQVRAEIAVMHSSADLEQVVTPLIWRKLTELGVPFLRCGVFIMDEENRHVHALLATPDGKPLGDITLPFDNSAPALSFVGDVIEHWRGRRFYTQRWDRQTFIETMRAMVEQDPTLDPTLYLDAKEPPASLNLHMAPFAQGMLYVGSEAPLHADDVRLTEELAAAFAVAYARFQDFQNLEEKNRALEIANTQVEEASVNKSQFLRRMSHDLRSPMNAIIGYSRLLRRRTADRLDEREQRNLANIETSSGNLLNLINDILDLSRIEAGRIEVNEQPVDVRQLTDECADALESIVQQGVVLRRDLADVGLINSDSDRLRQVVMNLLGNATKFTATGSITLSLRDGDGGIELSIADTGIGIPAEDLPHIFDEFRQVERQGGEQSEGTGLGLAIAKKTVELLGGEITATSAVGVGTTFTVRLGS
jgi:signal transduction histidine kinase